MKAHTKPVTSFLNLLYTVVVVFTLSFITSCTETVRPTVDLSFTNSVDGEELQYHEMIYLNEAGNNYNVIRLKYLLSKLTLHNEFGEEVLLEEIHFVDSDDEVSKFSNHPIKIPVGKYTSLSFTFGLDEMMNISNAYLANNELHSAMAWPEPMGGGYHYMRLEGAYVHSDSTEHFYNTHTGRWQEFNNHFELVFPLNMDAAQHDEFEINIDMNVNRWYSNPHTYNFEDYGVGIMGNLTAQNILSANGVDVFELNLKE